MVSVRETKSGMMKMSTLESDSGERLERFSRNPFVTSRLRASEKYIFVDRPMSRRLGGEPAIVFLDLRFEVSQMDSVARMRGIIG